MCLPGDMKRCLRKAVAEVTHSGEFCREMAEARAQRIIKEERERLGWKEVDLITQRKQVPVHNTHEIKSFHVQ
jgi:hypothetical protein